MTLLFGDLVGILRVIYRRTRPVSLLVYGTDGMCGRSNCAVRLISRKSSKTSCHIPNRMNLFIFLETIHSRALTNEGTSHRNIVKQYVASTQCFAINERGSCDCNDAFAIHLLFVQFITQIPLLHNFPNKLYVRTHRSDIISICEALVKRETGQRDRMNESTAERGDILIRRQLENDLV